VTPLIHTVKETLFGNAEFLKFLGQRLSLEKRDINLSHLAFDILACLLQVNLSAAKSFPVSKILPFYKCVRACNAGIFGTILKKVLLAVSRNVEFPS